MTTVADGFSFTNSFQQSFTTLTNYLPQLLGALIILIVGYIVAKVLEKVVARLLERFRVNESIGRTGVQPVLERSGLNTTPAKLIAKAVFWFVFIIVLTMFAGALGIPGISDFITELIGYIPNIVAAIVILFLAIAFGKFLAGVVRGVTNNENLAKATQILIIVYAVFAALVQLKIAQQLTGPTFLIVLGGVALAAGLAFGLGGRAAAEKFVNRVTDTPLRSDAEPNPARPTPNP